MNKSLHHMQFLSPKIWLALSAFLLGLFMTQVYVTAEDQSAGDTVYVITIDGAIGPASSDYIAAALEQAEESNARLLILEMDTPGGLDSAMRDMIKGILSSDVPVATFVSPSGSRAASAGTYILYASHIAAMAPATNLGSATPVSVSGDDIGKDDKAKEASDPDNEDDNATSGSTAMERKVMNDAIAYIKGLAEKRGRNAEWAEKAVREAANLTAEEALEKNVIDIIADDIPDLLAKIDGRVVSVNGSDVTLDTSALIVERIERDWRNKLIDAITNPTVAYMLMMLGIYGLMFEGYNPGVIVPGVVGAIAILLALYAFQILSVNYAGLALIILGIILMIFEAMAPSFGVLGLGGIVAFVIGSVILMDSDVPGFSLDLGKLLPIAGVAALGTLGLSWFAIKNQRRPLVSGVETLIDMHGDVRESFVNGEGTVWVNGERWSATCNEDLQAGTPIRVVSMDGLILVVEPTNSV